MTRRRRLILATGAAVIAPRAALAQQKTFQVAILAMGQDPARPERWDPFITAMRDLGYVEGKNLMLHRVFGAGKFERLPELVGNLVKANVDVIVVTGTREIRSAMQATSTIPIVMTLANDPVGEGFVASLARPGGNVTGLTALVPGLSQKFVELIREVFPTATHLAVVAMPPNPVPVIRREFEDAGRTRGIRISFAQPSGPDQFDAVFARLKREGASAIIHPIDGGTGPHRRAFVQAALKHSLSGIYWSSSYVEDGGLMTYSINTTEQFKRAAAYVDKLLRGARAADLPIEQPARVELVINMKTANALGITIPQGMRLRADALIE